MKFTVYGTPKPQGSMKAFTPKGFKRPIVTSDNAKLKPWRQQVSGTALSLGARPIDGPVTVSVDFFFQRPRSAAKRIGMTVKPDVDKLTRAVLDSLTGILFHDDSQVTAIHARKFYGVTERAEINVQESILEALQAAAPKGSA